MGLLKRSRDRYDATYVPQPRDFTAIFPHIMTRRGDAVVFGSMNVDVEDLLAYVEASKGTDHEVTFFQAVLLAVVKTLRQRPRLNRYVMGRRLYQRRDVVIGFTARRGFTDDASETPVLITITPDDDAPTMRRKITGQIRAAKSGEDKADDQLISQVMRLPRGVLAVLVKGLKLWEYYVDSPKFLRGVDPLHCSVRVTNLGSVGGHAPYHHLFEWGTCSLMVAVGKITRELTLGPDDEPVAHRMAQFRITIDERVTDGYDVARAMDLFVDYLAHPEKLERA